VVTTASVAWRSSADAEGAERRFRSEPLDKGFAVRCAVASLMIDADWLAT
jgi:hypothetical protein